MGERVGRWPLLPALTAAVWGILVVVLTVKNVITPHEHTLFPLYSQTAHQAWGDISFEPSPFGPSPFGKQYLPYFADLIAPFAYLPEPVGATLWSLLSLAIFITGMLRFFPLAGRQVLSANVWSVLLLAVPWLGLESLNNGQANVLNAGCLLWGAVLVARERWWLAALCLALPGFKIYPLALGLLLSALFPRLTPRFILAVLATLLLPFLLHPAERVWSGYANVFEYIRGGSHYVAYNFIDLRSFLEKCGLRIGPRPFLIVQAASGAVCLGAVWSMKRRGADAAVLCMAASLLVSLWFVVFGPSVEAPTLLLAAPALAWMLLRSFRHDSWSLRVGVLLALFIAGPMQTSMFGATMQRFVVNHKLACPGLTALFAWQLLTVFRWRPAATTELPQPLARAA